jgi:hypothetical protein
MKLCVASKESPNACCPALGSPGRSQLGLGTAPAPRRGQWPDVIVTAVRACGIVSRALKPRCTATSGWQSPDDRAIYGPDASAVPSAAKTVGALAVPGATMAPLIKAPDHQLVATEGAGGVTYRRRFRGDRGSSTISTPASVAIDQWERWSRPTAGRSNHCSPRP